MRRLIGLLLFIGIIGGLSFYILQRYAPDIIPPSKDIKQYLPLNSETLSPIKIPTGYKLNLFADLKNQKPKVLALDTKGVLYASIPSQGRVVAIPSKNDELSANVVFEILKGLNNPFGIAFDKNYFYLAEKNYISRYSYESDNYKLGPREVLVEFPKEQASLNRNLKVVNDKIYFINNDSIMVSNLDGSNITPLENISKNVKYFVVDKDGTVWKSDYNGIVLDSSSNLVNAVPGKIVKLFVFANGISNQEDYIYGFVQGTNELLGRPSDLIYDNHGNLFIADDLTGLIYLLTK